MNPNLDVAEILITYKCWILVNFFASLIRAVTLLRVRNVDAVLLFWQSP